MKPKQFKIFSCTPDNTDDGRHWVYRMETDESDREFAEHERRALLMSHAPELL